MKSHEINKQNNESVKLCQKAQFNLDFNCLICLSSTVAKKDSFILQANFLLAFAKRFIAHTHCAPTMFHFFCIYKLFKALPAGCGPLEFE